MAAFNAENRASNQPDQKILDKLVSVDKACLAVVTLIAATVLCGWMVPAIGAALPDGWSLMKANTALAMLLCTASLAFGKPKRITRFIFAGRVCACVAMILAGVALFEHWSGRSTGLDTLLTADSEAQMPGRMSIQTASFLMLLGLSLLIERTRQDLLGHMQDALIVATVLLTLVLVAGYIFSAANLVGQSPFARIALPISQVLVFLIIGIGEKLLTAGYLTLVYTAALTASCMAAILFFLIILLARKINDLERALRGMSFTDELTGLHNRRSFYLLGEQALLVARRTGEPLSVLFFDADGLKKINDTLGHDVGSELLRDIATLLLAVFRDSDVVGRLGGDEFAVITHASLAELTPVLLRLEDATEVANCADGKTYQISFSTGGAANDTQSSESFVELVDRADAAMYLNKRQRRAAREAAESDQQVAVADATPQRG